MDDTEAISMLTRVADPPVVKKQSLVHTLAFRSGVQAQGRHERRGTAWAGPAGTIDWIDASGSRSGSRRSKGRSGEAMPAAMIACGPVPDYPQREAIVRVSDAVARAGPRYSIPNARRHRARRDRPSGRPAVQDILQRNATRFSTARTGSIQTLHLAAQIELVADFPTRATSSCRDRPEAARRGPVRG
jgi:hypothetical protein